MNRAKLRQRVAEVAHKLQQNATTGVMVARSTNPDLAQLNDAIDTGAAEFARENPDGWAWREQWIEFTLTTDGKGPLNIEQGDATRYLLPDMVESVPQSDVFFRNGQIGGDRVDVRSIAEVARERFISPSEVGYPQFCAAQWNSTLAKDPQSRGAMEFQVFPTPDQAYTIGFLAIVGVRPFAHDNEYGPWPSVHDETVVAFAVRALFRHDREPGDPARKESAAEAMRQLGISIDVDNREYRNQAAAGPTPGPGTRGRVFELKDMTTGLTVLRVTGWN